MVAEASLKNLEKRKPFPKGVSGNPKGKPARRELIQFMRETYEQDDKPAAMKRLLKLMEKRCPQEIAHYLSGKPLEQIRIEANINANVVQQPTIELAAAAASRILSGEPEKAPLSLPSEEIKVPVIES